MATLPEVVLQQVLVAGFRFIRENDQFIDQLFQKLTRDTVQHLKDLFNSTSIDVSLALSKEAPKAPTVTIILGGEEETHPVLGNFMGKGYNAYDVTGVEDDQPGSNIPREHFKDEDVYDDVVDSQSHPRKMFDTENVIKERYGSMFTANYSLHIMTPDQLWTVFIYNLAKFILLDSQLILAQNQMIDMNLSGGDVGIVETYMPDIVYDRILNIQFVTTFDWFYGFNQIMKLDLNLDAYSMNVNPTRPCDSIGGLKPPTTSEQPVVSFGVDSYPLITQSLTIVGMTPSSITVDTETDVLLEGTNMHRDIEVEFEELPFRQLRSGGLYGITEISRVAVGDNNLRIRFKGYTTGSTSVKFTNPDSGTVTWETFYVTA